MNPRETAQDILAEALEFRGVVTGEVRDAFRRRVSYALMVEMSAVRELFGEAVGETFDEEEQT